jgi:general secretion pathway protein H
MMTRRRHPASSSTPSTAGFTLFELLVVLAIIGLIMAITPLLTRNAVQNAQVKAAAETLAADLKWSRQRAISTGQETRIVFDLAARRYTRTADGTSRELPQDVRLVETARGKSPTAMVRFFPDGSSTGGRFDIVRGTRTYEVSVLWPFGRVQYGERS